MSLEENKGINRKGIEAANKRNLAMLDKVIAPDFVDNFLQARADDTVRDLDQDDMLGGRAWKETKKGEEKIVLPLSFSYMSD